MRCDPYALLAEVATAFEVGSWLLVGGLMVHCHAQKCLSTVAEAWAPAVPANRVRAVQCIQAFRQDWVVPSFLGSTTVAASTRRRPAPRRT